MNACDDALAMKEVLPVLDGFTPQPEPSKPRRSIALARLAVGQYVRIPDTNTSKCWVVWKRACTRWPERVFIMERDGNDVVIGRTK